MRSRLGWYTHQEGARAQAVIEFAIVLPILLLLMLGLINLGVLINAQIILTQAAWEGARTGATLYPDIEDGDSHIVGAIDAAVTGLTNPDAVIVAVSPSDKERNAMQWPKPRGESLQVNLAYPLQLSLPFPVTVKLGAQATSRIEYSNPP